MSSDKFPREDALIWPPLSPSNIFEDTALVMLLWGVCSSPALLTRWWWIPATFFGLAVLNGVVGYAVRRAVRRADGVLGSGGDSGASTVHRASDTDASDSPVTSQGEPTFDDARDELEEAIRDYGGEDYGGDSE